MKIEAVYQIPSVNFLILISKKNEENSHLFLEETEEQKRYLTKILTEKIQTKKRGALWITKMVSENMLFSCLSSANMQINKKNNLSFNVSKKLELLSINLVRDREEEEKILSDIPDNDVIEFFL